MPSIAEVRQKYPQYNDMSDAALTDALHAKFYSDMPKEQFAAKMGAAPANDQVDTTTGAPYSVRAAVGSMPEQISPGAGTDFRLKAIQKTFPDAQPTGDGNYTYTDPKTGKKTLYNPQGLDTGDFASILPQIAEGVGGAAGAVGGFMAGGPMGAIPGAGAGAVAGREAIERGSMALQGIPDTRGIPEQMLNDLPTFTLNAAGQAGGEMLGAGVRAGVRGAIRGGKAGVAEMNSAISDLGRFGATPSIAQATKSPALDSAESLTAKFPGGAGVIRQKAEEQQAAVAAGVQAKLTNLAGIAPDEIAAGTAITKGVGDSADLFLAKAKVLYGEVGKYLPPDSPVVVTNTMRILDDVARPVEHAEEFTQPLLNPKLVQMLEGLKQSTSKNLARGNYPGNALPYQAISETRSQVGRLLGSPSLAPDSIPRADLKRVYGALTDDMRIAAQAQGPNALKAFDRAHAFYKQGMDRIDNILEPLIRNRVPEEAFAAVEMVGKRGPTRLQELRNSVTPDQWNLISATVADRLGRPPAGQRGIDEPLFSFQKFLRGYEGLRDNGSADVLFGKPGSAGIRDDLDALMRAAGRIQESSKAFANLPNTASTLVGQTMILAALGGLASAPFTGLAGLGTAGTVAGATVSAWGMAKLLTNKTAVHWLAEGTRVAPNGLGAWIGRASAIAANADPDTRDAITGFLGNLAAVAPQPLKFTPPGGAQPSTVH